MTSESRPAVDLSNCALEPIHVPGSIQPHGALVAFTLDGRLASASANAAAMFGGVPQPGQPIGDAHFTAAIRTHLSERLRSGRADMHEVQLADGRIADLGVHVHDSLLVAELEPRAAGVRSRAEFALLAQHALERIQQQSDLDALLAAGVEAISELSGFDRVMAYRFHADDSGEVVAEHMRQPLESFLGLRYPASDIPAQARRLFVANPVRVIADVAYRPVPLEPDRNPLTGGPVDLSFAALRSVSPIHVEYLTNMGVQASMSISIVSRERLWGLFACHHYAPHMASPAVRVTCRLLSQVVSMMVERFLAVEHARALAESQRLRALIADRVKADEDMVRALGAGSPPLTQLAGCAGAAVTLMGQAACLEATPAAADLGAIVRWLEAHGAPEQFLTSHVAGDAPELVGACGEFAGFAAIRFSPEPGAYILWFRREQIETQRWAGDPDKPVVLGQHGARLSPRGSFTEWKQVVRHRSEPWSDDERSTLAELRHTLMDVAAHRLQDTVRTRELLLAMLGHDLRNPLQAIAMAGEVLRIDETRAAQVQKQIARNSGRMGRLINHIMDLSRLHAGVGLVGTREPRDIDSLVRDVVGESRAAHPQIEIVERYGNPGPAAVDADRILQVMGNLVSNARHHGTAGKPIVVETAREGDTVVVRTVNHGHALTEEVLQTLFEPFKRGSLDNPNNPRGVGMGLYIAQSIVREHHGTLGVQSRDGLVIFTVTLPVEAAQEKPSG